MLMQKEFLWFLFHMSRCFQCSCRFGWLFMLITASLSSSSSCWALAPEVPAQHGSKQHYGCGDRKTSFVCRARCFASGWLMQMFQWLRDDIWLRRHAVLGLRFSNSGALVDNWTFVTNKYFHSEVSRFLSIILLTWQQKRFVKLPGTKSSAQHGRSLDVIQGHFASDGL